MWPSLSGPARVLSGPRSQHSPPFILLNQMASIKFYLPSSSPPRPSPRSLEKGNLHTGGAPEIKRLPTHRPLSSLPRPLNEINQMPGMPSARTRLAASLHNDREDKDSTIGRRLPLQAPSSEVFPNCAAPGARRGPGAPRGRRGLIGPSRRRDEAARVVCRRPDAAHVQRFNEHVQHEG